jgi:hypothetical protein
MPCNALQPPCVNFKSELLPGYITRLLIVPLHADLLLQPPNGQVRLDQLATAGITLLQPLKVSQDQSGQHLAAYCTALWGAMPSVREVRLEWPGSAQLLQHLPGVSALQQLSVLRLGGSCSEAEVDQAQVLRVVQGAAQLRELSLGLELLPGSSKDQLVQGLQEALSALTLLEARDPAAGVGGTPLAPDTLAALRPGLKVAWG